MLDEANFGPQVAARYQEGRQLPPATMDLWDGLIRAHVMKDSTILDAGAGTGRFIPILKSVSSRLICLDKSIHMLRAIPRRTDSRIYLLEGDATQSPFRNRTFSHIFASAFIHHVDLNRFFAEANRILNGGGSVLIRGTLADDLHAHPLHGLSAAWEIAERAQLPDKEKIIRIAQEHGFLLNSSITVMETVAASLADYRKVVGLRSYYSLRTMSVEDYRDLLRAFDERNHANFGSQEVKVPVTLITMRKR
jgi:SAM-dependent methyltransferase